MNSTSEHHVSLSRRHFLRGLGVCVALPAFESLGLVATRSPRRPGPEIWRPPRRVLRCARPSFTSPTAPYPRRGGPQERAPISSSKSSLAPLEPVKRSIQVLGGLNHRTANGGPDGAGDHARGNGTFLTGVRLKKSATDIRAGISIDQVIARRIGQLTRFPSLELATDAIHRAGACDSGYACAYQYNLSWSSPTTPMTPETNPRLVFERLFGSGAPGERTRQPRATAARAAVGARFRSRRGPLDATAGLQPGDKGKLDQYLTGVRELETRIEKVGTVR